MKRTPQYKLEENTGGLSSTGKMPCQSWSLSAYFCNVGQRLAKIVDSVCNGCYAMDGQYQANKKTITKAHHRKIAKFEENMTAWTENFIELLHRPKYADNGFWRWFDSGDIYNYEMLLCIVSIANGTPHIKHWLPTKEYDIIRQYHKEFGDFPENLNVRVSAPMVDTVLTGQANSSSVWKNSDFKETPNNRLCRAFENDGECKKCRLCWDKSVQTITYKYH
jgi:hypothetical protein